MCDFISSTNGWDLINDCKQEFIDKIKNYNIFINNAHLSGHQVKLLDWTNEAWDQGFVFNIGSFSEIFAGDTGDIENNYISLVFDSFPQRRHREGIKAYKMC